MPIQFNVETTTPLEKLMIDSSLPEKASHTTQNLGLDSLVGRRANPLTIAGKGFRNTCVAHFLISSASVLQAVRAAGQLLSIVRSTDNIRQAKTATAASSKEHASEICAPHPASVWSMQRSSASRSSVRVRSQRSV